MSDQANQRNSNEERIGVLESSVKGLYNEFSEIRETLRRIQDAISRSKETNWGVILAGIAIVGSLWLAAIRPITQDIERQTSTAKDIATAVLVKEEKITQQRIDFEKLSKDVTALQRDLADTRSTGAPFTDKRLALVEFELRQIEQVRNQNAK
jgi:hypothetical protein